MLSDVPFRRLESSQARLVRGTEDLEGRLWRLKEVCCGALRRSGGGGGSSGGGAVCGSWWMAVVLGADASWNQTGGKSGRK